MSFVATTLNHFRAIRNWADQHDAKATMNMRTFEVEIFSRSRYFTLFPQFLAKKSDQLMYTSELIAEATGFAGWLPYKPIKWDLSDEKLVFKKFIHDAQLPTPAWCDLSGQLVHDYVLKSSTGSFGNDIRGPYRRNEPAHQFIHAFNTSGELYAEQFIEGKILKLWCWGEQPFHAHLHDFPTLCGDGKSTVLQLINRLLHRIGDTYESYKERPAIDIALQFQGIDTDTVLTENQSIWIDYRYGRSIAMESLPQDKDNALHIFSAEVVSQVMEIVAVVAPELLRKLGAPVLYAIDGILDKTGKIWWLEINSNPMVAPTGYPHIFATLFGVAALPSR